MDKVLMIADDLTGALDAGVAFASAGIATCVGQGDYFLASGEASRCSVQVTVVPSRHMTGADAYESVYDVVRKAANCGFTCIYKKTDSALRGNIGAELEAVLAGAEGKNLYFVPAFPKMNRITRGGIQLIDGCIPVEESVFGADPFNPVRHSDIAQIIGETSDVQTYLADPEAAVYPEGIAIFDAETDTEIGEIAAHLFGPVQAKLVAGCAGLASALPQTLMLEQTEPMNPCLPPKMIVFCGSINPISLRQCAEAEKRGAPRFHLIQDGGFREEAELAAQIVESAQHHPITVMDTGSADVDTKTMDAASGRVIAEKVSSVIRMVSAQVQGAVLFIIGGDTLIALIQSLGIETIIPVTELFPGIVLAKYPVHGQWQYLISKSGGFGEPALLEDISRMLSAPEARKMEVLDAEKSL